MRILTVIFEDDLHQLKMQALTLEKNWKDKKAWTIVIENRYPEVQQKHFDWIQENIVPLMLDWDLDIVRGESAYEGPGWIRQQIFKLYYSSLIQDDWVLVLDAKNFLINHADESTFIKTDGIYKFVTGVEDQFHKDLLEDAKLAVGVTEEIPYPSAMTPWVWNTHDLRSLIQHINFSKDLWPYGRTTEFGIYWAWAYNKHNWVDHKFSVSGFWGNDTDETRCRYLANKANSSYIFWVHHRYAHAYVLRELTATVLERSGITRKDTNDWDRSYKYLMKYKTKDIIIDNDQRSPTFK